MRESIILVVDDMNTIRTIVVQTLKVTLGVKNILEATNGKEALAILRSEKVDIVISDWNMPVMDGEEFLYEVRQDPLLQKLPFLMMTANADKDFIVTAIQLGVTNYLVKPFTPAELEEKMRLAWGSFNKRNNSRHASLPKHLVKIRVDRKVIDGQFLDVSQTGACVKLLYDPCLYLFRPCDVTLELIDPQGVDSNTAIISSMYSMIVRLEAENCFNPTSKTCILGLYFPPDKMKKEMGAKLNKVLQWLNRRSPETIGDKRK